MTHREDENMIPARERISEQARGRLRQKLEQGVQCLDDEDVRLLKDLKDPRVFLETDQGNIELAEKEAYMELDALAPQTFERRQLRDALDEHTIFATRNKKGEMVNFCTARRGGEGILWVPFIFTRNDQHGQGHASRMLKYLIDYHTRKSLTLSRDKKRMLNENMLRKLGFEPAGTPESDEWVFIKPEPMATQETPL